MSYVQSVVDGVKQRNIGQPEFHQAVTEVLLSLAPLLDKDPKYAKHKILERLVEPDRLVEFRVAWQDDAGQIQVNRGYRVQFSNAVGPYKGGLRFHPSVNAGIVKFLGFEQIFKNSLTGLPIGGGKGGSNFDPKGKSDAEVMRFCQAFMTELVNYVGPTIDVPAGDIGVGAREIGYLTGQYRRLTRRNESVFTGKGIHYGGSLARTEATGYGSVYFAESMMKDRGKSLEGAVCAVSGSGNVAIYTIEKLWQIGAKPVTASDSGGMIYHAAGIDLKVLKEVKLVEKARLTRYAELCPDAVYTPVEKYQAGRNAVWSIPCVAAFPSATQNELNVDDAKELLKNGCVCVTEGANMPSTLDAIGAFQASGICYAPSKASNAGGVAVSQLEMSQNASLTAWSFGTVDNKLREIMDGIFTTTSETAKEFGQPGNLVLGANIGGFRKVAQCMIDLGIY